MSWPLYHQGSVKDILGEKGSSEYVFSYSDRFSVFDWGAMPDELDEKGKSLAFMADFFFRHLDIPHHGKGLCDENGELSSVLDRYYKVQAVDVHYPSYNKEAGYGYETYRSKPTNCLVPLEVIFRFGVPKGSSFIKRATDKVYLEELGISHVPGDGELLASPIVEYSTKLESSDRYLAPARACEIAALSHSEMDELRTTTEMLAKKLYDSFKEIGVTLWDGKFEFAFIQDGDRRSFMLVDSIGPDELRLSYDGHSLSKEFLREFYKKHDWYLNVEKSKSLADERKDNNWKSICMNELSSNPPRLDPQYKKAAEMLYLTLANELSLKYENKAVFPNAYSLNELVASFKNLKQ